MIKITNNLSINTDELEFGFTRSSGPGGQHVNKVETAVQIKFDVKSHGGINDAMFNRLRKLAGQKMNSTGVLTITAESTRSQHRNKELAIERLVHLLKEASIVPKVRRKTKPSQAARRRRMDEKKKRGTTKKLRGKVTD